MKLKEIFIVFVPGSLLIGAALLYGVQPVYDFIIASIGSKAFGLESIVGLLGLGAVFILLVEG